jgi:hypothetical protein
MDRKQQEAGKAASLSTSILVKTNTMYVIHLGKGLYREEPFARGTLTDSQAILKLRRGLVLQGVNCPSGSICKSPDGPCGQTPLWE